MQKLGRQEVQRLELCVIKLRIWGRRMSLLKEATAKYFKQQSTKLKLLEVCYSGDAPGLKVVR